MRLCIMRKRHRRVGASGFRKEKKIRVFSPTESFHQSCFCLHQCSLIPVSWIFLVIINSIFFRTVGLQGTSSNYLPWSTALLKGAMAEKHDVQIQMHHEINPIFENEIGSSVIDATQEKSIKDSFNSAWQTLESSKCDSSFHGTFMPMVMQVCLLYPDPALDHSASKSIGVFDLTVPVNNETAINQRLDNHNLSITEVILHNRSVDEAILDDTKGAVSRSPEEIIDKASQKLQPILTNVQVRQEPGDEPYNYASDSKGAKVLASNKEAKGASNILNKDKDKYLRTPCSSENKYVDLELSEETLVISFAIANHEFYSSNVRQLELWGSSLYPTEKWDFLGTFDAMNVRVMQTFKLDEPKWVRYLRLRMVNHYGTDFYCTLSALEVYGVDAIEWLLEDWIAEETGAGARTPTPTAHIGETVGKMVINAQLHSKVASAETLEDDLFNEETLNGSPLEMSNEISEVKGKLDTLKEISRPDKVQAVYHQTSRPALDAVLKLLMTKVRSLEQSQPLLTQYVQDINDRCARTIKRLEQDVQLVSTKLENTAVELANLKSSFDSAERWWLHEKHMLQKELSDQVKTWNADIALMRSHLKDKESKEMVAFGIALLSTITMVAVQMVTLCLHLLKILMSKKIESSKGNPCTQSLWVVPFLSCILVMFVLSL